MAAIAVAAMPWAARAVDQDELYRECYQGAVADRVIAACTVIIRDRIGDTFDLAAAFKNRGDAYDDKDEYELALTDYSASLGLVPRNAEVFNGRGTTQTALGRYELAIRDFDRAIELDPAKAMAFSNRCFARAVLGQLENALADCDEAIRLQPGRLATSGSRGFVYLKLGRADEAIADYDRMLQQRPDDPYALYGRAAARLIKGNLRGSDDDVVRAQAAKPDIVDYMDRIGVRLGEVSRTRGG